MSRIVISFDGETAGEIAKQMREFLALGDKTFTEPVQEMADATLTAMEQALRELEAREEAELKATSVPEPEPAPEAKPPKRKHRATTGARGGAVNGSVKPVKPEPPEPRDEVEEVDVASDAPDEEVEAMADDSDNPFEDPATARQKAVDLIRLKEKQLDRLKDLWVSGKGAFVRELLKKYGNGAKSFPEIDAGQFVDISNEIDREAKR